MSNTFSPRIRFNWGFWDGYAVKAYRDVSRHFDKDYAAGHEMGWQYQQSGITVDSSDPAWKEHQDWIGAKRQARKVANDAWKATPVRC